MKDNPWKNILLILFTICVGFIGCINNNISWPEAFPHTSIPKEQKTASILIRAATYQVEGKSIPTDFCTIYIPENRHNSESRLIEVPVVRIHSINQAENAPIFWLGGGFGMSNLQFPAFLKLIEQHDFVVVGYRGIDGSVSLKSPEIRAVLEQAKDLFDEQTHKKMAYAFENTLQRYKGENIDYNAYTLEQIVYDIEEVRYALGYSKINLCSLSSGTQIAYLYAHSFADNVKHNIMISPIPPGRLYNNQIPDYVISSYIVLRQKEINGDKLPNISDNLLTALSIVKKKQADIAISYDNFRLAVYNSLLSTDTAPLVFSMASDVLNNDFYGIKQATKDPLSLSAYSNGLLGYTMLRIVISENVWQMDNKEFGQTQEFIGNPQAELRYNWLAYLKGSLPELNKELSVLKSVSVPTLLICGDLDPIYPASYVIKEMLPFFSQAKIVKLSHCGHGITNIFLTDVLTIIMSYLKGKEVNSADIPSVPIKWD